MFLSKLLLLWLFVALQGGGCHAAHYNQDSILLRGVVHERETLDRNVTSIAERKLKKDKKPQDGECQVITTDAALANAIALADSDSAISRTVTICTGTIAVSAPINLQLTNPITVRCAKPHLCLVVPDTSPYLGAFIVLDGGSFTFIGIDVSGFYGRAFSGTGTKLSLIDCDFRINTLLEGTPPDGGAVYVRSASILTVISCSFLKNGVPTTLRNLRGGAVAAVGRSSVSISKCSFSGNIAQSFGGAVYVADGGNITVSQTLFSSSRAGNRNGRVLDKQLDDNSTAPAFSDIPPDAGNDDSGGAIFLDNIETATFSKVTFQNNNAPQAGGALYMRNSKAKLGKGCIFDSNDAGGYGGAVFVDTDSTLENAKPKMFTGNSAGILCADVCYQSTGLCFPA